MSEAKRFKFGKRNVSLFCHIHAAEPAAESIVETNFDRIDIPLEGQSAAGADHAGARPAVQSESCTPTYPLADCPPTRRGIFISMKSGARPGRRQGRAPARRPRYPERSRQVSCCPGRGVRSTSSPADSIRAVRNHGERLYSSRAGAALTQLAVARGWVQDITASVANLDPPAHAAARLRVRARRCRSRHQGLAGLPRPQKHSAHRTLHRVGPGSVQEFLALGATLQSSPLAEALLR
jgi:hypothetical protein